MSSMLARSFFLTCTAAVAAPAPSQCPAWSDVFGASSVGANGPIHASLVFDDGTGPALIAAGSFTTIGGVPASSIARWSGTSWAPLGGGLNATVRALASFDWGAGPRLIAAGRFETGSGPHGGVAVWDGTSWSTIGLFPQNPDYLAGVHALAVFADGTGPHLYAGGDMVGAVQRWNGSSWTIPGGGFEASGLNPEPTVHAFAVFDDGSGPRLFAGGQFQFGAASPGSFDNIASFDGTTWTPAGSLGGYSNMVESLDAFDDGSGAVLYAGGSIPATPPGVARWNGSVWTALPSSVNGLVSHVHALGPASGVAPGLWVGGTLTQAGGAPANRVARWDGTSWHAEGGANAFSNVRSVAAFDDGTGAGTRVFAFDAGGAVQALANGTWSFLATPAGNGADATVRVLAAVQEPSSSPRLFAGGFFVNLGPTSAVSLGSWDGAHWSSGPITTATQVTCTRTLDDGSGSKLYVATWQGGGWPANILRLDGSSWTTLPAFPFDSPITSMAFFDSGGGLRLHVAATGNVWRLDGGAWSIAMAPDVPYVYELIAHDDGSGPALFLAGNFSMYGPPFRGVARWNGTTLTNLAGGASGPDPRVDALCVYDDGSGPSLVAGGRFTAMGGVPCSNIARWNGTAWSALGAGIAGTGALVKALCVLDDGLGSSPKLAVGGKFTLAGGLGASHVALWDGSSWSSLGSGIAGSTSDLASPIVNALASFDDGTGRGADLFVGGAFTSASGVSSTNVARWTSCGGSASTFCHGDGSATACPCGNASPVGARAGCLHSFGTGGTLRVHGRARIGADTLVLDGGSMTNSSVLYFQGANLVSGGMGVAFGDGLKCAAGPFIRFATKVNVAGASSYPSPGDAPVSIRGNVTSPGTRYYQARYRNSAPFCTSDSFNYTNGIVVQWEL